MEAFGEWLSTLSMSAESALAAHARLVTIHPFTDGNGRTARLLMNVILLKGGYPPIVIAPEHRLDYIQGLEALQLRDDHSAYRNFMRSRLDASLDYYLTILRPSRDSYPDLST